MKDTSNTNEKMPRMAILIYSKVDFRKKPN